MKQILQSLKTGQTEVAEVPSPGVRPGHLLIRTTRTLVSAGTERMLVEFGRAGWIEKARQQPDRVRQVIDKMKTDGVATTIHAVQSKLDQPLALGYCNVGVVVEAGVGVDAFVRGDRVASNGKHAEVVSVPASLCAKVPDSVSDEEASFTVLGAIALQGIRLIGPTLGESVVVVGAGLIGLVTIQLLRAQGCRVLATDFDRSKLDLARSFGAEVADLGAGADPVMAANVFSRGRGVDAVIITASTQSSEPVHQAALMCRKRGRIVLVGVAGLELSRADFYEKELSFQVSCSYGPGRYDPSYEEKGNDYPIGFVRWTAQRNFEAVLDMMADHRLDVRPLISHRMPIESAKQAYDLISGSDPSLGILLEYSSTQESSGATTERRTVRLVEPRSAGRCRVALIGSGGYATGVLIPALTKTPAALVSVVSSGGVTSLHAARKFGFAEASTDVDRVLESNESNTVIISTRHDTHGALVTRALDAGKHVFVEKPLAIRLDEIASVRTAYENAQTRPRAPILMVGFNRRFSPHVKRIHALLAGVPEPKTFVMTVNAGSIPATHWTQDPSIGGGRIIGEGCHFIDLLRHLAGAPIAGFDVLAMGAPWRGGVASDQVSIALRFDDGSIGSIHYLSNGHKSFAKERLEVFAGGRVLQLDNFRRLNAFGWPGFTSMRLWRQDKGQQACIAAFVDAVERGAPSPISFDEVIEVSRITVEIGESVR